MIRPLQIGKHRQRVILQDIPASSVDSYGQPSQGGLELARLWAEVMALQGNEMLNVRQIWPTATHRVKLRWLGSLIPTSPTNPFALVLPRMRLQLLNDNSYLNILWAENVEKRNRQWILTCEEKVLT